MEYKEAKKKENTQSKQQKEKKIQNSEDGAMSLWNIFEHTNIHIMGVPERGERESKKL